MNQARLAAWAPMLQAVLRIMTGLLFLEHGLMKLVGFPHGGPPPPPPGGGAPSASFMMAFITVAGVLEVGGGALFALGFCTRIVAFIISGEMAVGYFMVHAPQGFFPATNGGDAAILFCFIFLFYVAAGPGAWSVDGLIRRKPA